MQEGLSKELIEFIIQYVDSVELLEVLVLLHSDQNRNWSVSELHQVIQSNTASIEYRLQQLINLGLVIKIAELSLFQFQPATEQMRTIGTKLVLAYQARRIKVTELIYTKPMKEIISFSNAFRIRKEKKDG